MIYPIIASIRHYFALPLQISPLVMELLVLLIANGTVVHPLRPLLWSHSARQPYIMTNRMVNYLVFPMSTPHSGSVASTQTLNRH